MPLNFSTIIEQARQLTPLRTAVVHPVTVDAISGATTAAEKKLIIPVLIGPSHKIKKAAQEACVDLAAYELIATKHSHAAAEEAVKLAHAGDVSMIMKGSLHTDEFMHAIIHKTHGLRTGQRMSHVFVAEVPNYNKLLLLSDCALNIQPDLDAKRDIVQNAIFLAQAIGIVEPKVAILSAIETVTSKLQSTLDAAALCKMADRQQIKGGLLDGPLAFDNAISLHAAKVKGIHSSVAGDADILIVPDLESGNMLAKQLEYFANAELAGIVVGARLPIVLTSRADDATSRLTSCALGLLHYQSLTQKSYVSSSANN